MRFDQVEPEGIKVFGDQRFRGKCPPESVEMVTFFGWVRRTYPETHGALAVHPRNEGQLRGGQFRALARVKAEGMMPGAADVILPGSPALVIEMKRQDHTKSTWQPGQVAYLIAAARAGCFVSVALGFEAARQALMTWEEEREAKRLA